MKKPAIVAKTSKKAPAKKIKTYVIDTNVLIDDTSALTKFKGQEICIPIKVVAELEKHKVAKGELGARARNVLRQIGELTDAGNILEGVFSENNSKISVIPWNEACKAQMEKHTLDNTPDNQILSAGLQAKEAGKDTVLITNDVSFSIQAKATGLTVQSHQSDKRPDSIDDIYAGIQTCIVDGDTIDDLFEFGECEVPEKFEFTNNGYVNFIDELNESHTGIARFTNGKLIKVVIPKQVSNIKPRNVKQGVALDAMMNDSITMVSVIGSAGGGKTICALGAAIELVLNQKRFDKIVLCKNPVPVESAEIGFLPGSEYEKLLPFYASFLDALAVIFPGNKQSPEELMVHLMEMGVLEIAPPTFMRGRSINNALIILDEGQNCSPSVMKTILTRLGDKSRIFILGDINQIDTPKLDAFSNGLTHVLEAFKGQDCAAHITFTKAERSTFAGLAAELL